MQDYQRVTPLTIGELWALPTMLRIGTLEHLAAAVAVIAGIDEPKGPNAQPILPIPPAQPTEAIVANCFLSLRLLSATDWKGFFEQTSRIEQILRDDPAGIYPSMDFDTRNRYRSVVEELARNSSQSEEAVARAAIEFARQAQDKPQASIQNPDRKTHIGFYLIDAGLPALERSIGYRPQLDARLRRWALAHPTLTYLGSISILSLLIVAGLLAYTRVSNGSPAQLVLTGLLGCGLALDASINLVHWTITHQIPPRTLPRMDYSEGIPAGYRTMIVIPSLLVSVSELNSLLQELELHFLRNPDPQLTFALLTDFTDAPAQQMPDDEQLLSQAVAGIEGLNHKYADTAPFYLFHRKRVWNPSEGVWMGWERKRGKLVEFNRLVLNGGQTSYTTRVGELSILPAIKYVITLDADTSLPQGSAGRMVATLAHPLNQAEFTADGHSVRAGYTILQPRVEIKPASANRSLFSRIFAGNTGFDLYTLAVSDVYQDLFGEGSYVGKGIYDVAAFERSLAGRVRENTLLSHDLFEGIYGRAALVTDILLYEEYPARYLIYARRMHRWIRGDWQLLPWLFPVVQTEGGSAPNWLSLINRWKIFDNLRRSLLTPTYLFFFAASWLVLPGSPLLWTLLALLVPAMPIAAQAIQGVKKNIGRLRLKELVDPSRLPLLRWALSFTFLPYEAFLALTAIGITLTRLLVARRHLLQWTTAAHIARSLGINTRQKVWWEMAISLAFSALLGLAIAIVHPLALWVATPLLLVWSLAPQVAYWISQPIMHTSAPLSEVQYNQVRRLARRTWAFFEQFAGPDDHWLPPDHFQENPRGNVAHYTTPTNIGLFLLSILSAYDLGYFGLFELAVRLRSTFENMDALEHYRGHLLNWYDTQTLAPLPPRYISTVDSGNLAACLIALKQGCLALADAPIVGPQQWQGLLVLMDILSNILKELDSNNSGSAFEPFEVELQGICRRITAVQDNPGAWTSFLAWLVSDGRYRISRHVMEFLGGDHPNLDQETLNDLQLYLDGLLHQLISMQRNIKLLAPWLSALNQPPRLFAQAGHPALHAWQDFLEGLPTSLPPLGEAAVTYEAIKSALARLGTRLDGSPDSADLVQETRDWCRKLDEDLTSAMLRTETLLVGYRDLARQADRYLEAMDFKFLFDEQRRVFHIGYNATTDKLDTSYYDLLASEARIASLIAIAKGDVPQSHWLHLGRPVTRVDGKQVLLSWNGTMFEYLMPALFTRNYEGTFLSDSCHAAIDAQMSYAHQKHIPWGASESGYFAFDASLNYQYRAFGVPDLGYKRDLSEEVVVAPYASLIGLSLQPQAVLANMARLENLKMLGRFGFYEALDYTRARLAPDLQHAIVQSYMAHHQGMILLAACNYLSNDGMVRRFHADERIQSVELLLQEKIPQNPHIEYPHPEEPLEVRASQRSVALLPWRVPVDSPIPQVQFLSQGRYGVLITNAGGGYSQWEDLALTRWQADATLDAWGTWIYLQDLESGELWSAACQPTGCPPENQEILFYPYKVEFRRWDRGVSLHTEITVGADDVEIRRVTLLNDSDRQRRLKVTSYGEVVLAPQADDRRHPAFNKLFIESEYLSDGNALLFHRRLRSADEKPVFLAHALVVEAGHKVTGEYESDRACFLGRGQTPRTPAALQGKESHLSGTIGPEPEPGLPRRTLDPILSLAQEIDLKPHTRAQVTFITLAAASRTEALELVTRYQSMQAINRAFDEARAHGERELVDLGLNTAAVEHIQQLLSALLYPSEALRAAPEVLEKNVKGQSGLWAYGISGDYPVLLVRVREEGDSPLLLEALQAYTYWRNRRIKINLVILNEQDTGYAMDLHNQIQRQITLLGADAWLNQRDGIFLLRSDQMPKDDRILLEAIAGVILDQTKGTLAEHARRLTAAPIRLPAFTPSLAIAQDPEPTPPLRRPTGLRMDNGLGGFSPDGREYVLFLQPGQNTPRPWVNVIANPQFGFLVSEAGSGFTWAGNSGENRLTPWRNDPLADMPGEALYLRDEETGLVWSPTPLPAGAESACTIRHGAGYSTFESQSHGLNQLLRLFAAADAPVKIAHLRLENLWNRPRRITVTSYAEWVLGAAREPNQAYVVPEFDPARHALLAGNRYNAEFGERAAFLAASKKPHGLTADRSEFLGRLGSLRTPAALGRIGLASTVRAGLDPCAAIQLHVDLAPGGVEEVFFLLGEGSSREESLALIAKYQAQGQIELAWQAVQHLWDDLLTGITVQTPDPGMDLMLNRWLLYQTISCRLWGRSALYQSGGAFGFRDQLQDVLAALHTRPGLAREQILNAARRQFEAGDVLHWWHPPSGRGVRTRYSDDLLWLPFVTAEYVAASGDVSILDERIPFLKGEALKPEETERYGQYEPASEGEPLYEHCRRAVEKGATAGVHGLPLMGSGDWNDGMNRVGWQGRGESVWLGWFLHATLTRFSSLCLLMKDDPEPYRQQAARLARALELHAWDGNWYLRAFYDDSARLGSSENDECRIDSIAQSWAVLSQAADPERAARAMESVDQLLIREDDQLILLLAPPFDKTGRDPGYIQGYAPGVRENGGQYTHAAIWVAWAFAMLGQGDRAGELFRLLNPIYHADTPEKARRYRVEPYGIAADVYSQPPFIGTGGWTWYTGSAGWMYRLGIEAILGLTRVGDTLKFDPCIPGNWPGFQLTYRFGRTPYLIRVENPEGFNRGIRQILLNGIPLPDNRIPLSDDGHQYEVRVLMGSAIPLERKKVGKKR
ncbi:MAG TPA: glucoamylase family protein [Anaerolineaceae bacterium]|nr:glucoamylase family protein [Anaerolineaceae bacterium]